MNKKSLLITGARGFIGKNIVEYFEQIYSNKYNIFYPYHKELDLLDSEKVAWYLKEKNIKLIIHAANVGGERKTAYDEGKTDVVSSNLKMFFNLARNIDDLDQMIHFGTGAEYSIKHYRPKMSEDYFDEHIPDDSYGFSKYVISKYIEKSEKIINLRLFGVFGKYEDYTFRFISNAIVKNLLGLPIVINQNVNFDYLYVADLMRIVAYFLENGAKYKFYNAVRGKTIEIASIAKMINETADKPSAIIVKNSGLNKEYSGNNERLIKEMNNFYFTSIRESLKDLYGWYKENIKTIDCTQIENDEYLKYCRIKK